MDHEDIVWAFQPLKELNNETGLVFCDHKLAARLISEGKAQDPRDGAHYLKEIEAGQVYKTKVMKAEKPRRSKSSKADKESK